MAIEMDYLRKLLDEKSLKYFLAPDRPVVMLAGTGLTGYYQFAIQLEREGRFLQFRSMNYLRCPTDHPHADAVRRLLLELDYRYRLVKFGWDARDGEIVAYLDHVVMDGTVTTEQLNSLVDIYLPAIDFNHFRIRTTMETGTDPGEGALPVKPEAPQVEEI